MEPFLFYLSMKKFVVIVAGGSGTRMGGNVPKQFIEIGGLPVLMHTIRQFYECGDTFHIILVLPAEQIPVWKELCLKHDFFIKHQLVEGGSTRFQSVKNALKTVENDGLVAIHDGVRPFVSVKTIVKSFEVAQISGNAVAAVKLKDSIRITDEKGDSKAIDRNKCYLIQTPQTFRSSLIKKAFEIRESPDFTDDATVLERLGEKINLIDGSYQNIKITTPEDLIFANAFLLLAKSPF